MLRKVGHIILFLLLFITTTGLIVSKHFCREVLISASVYLEAENCCEKECCRNQSEFLQLDEDYQVSEVTQVPAVFFSSYILETGFLLMSDLQYEKQYLPVADDPPPTEVPTRLSLKQSYLL